MAIDLKRIKNSRAYLRAARSAEQYVNDADALTRFADKAFKKANKYKEGSLRDAWSPVSRLVRLVKSYATGSYREIGWSSLLLMITALVYFVIPTDVIPDFILGWGLIDDITLLGWVINVSKAELDKFQQWEEQGSVTKSSATKSGLSGRRGEPTKTRYEVSGVGINVYEWAGTGDPLVLFHATGFHGMCWDYIVRQLPEDTHIYALDAPGHGLSDNPEMPFTWDSLSSYMAGVVETLNLTDVCIVGHSFGGYAATMVAAKYPERFKQVLLLDPVIMDPKMVEFILSISEVEHPVARRRNEWSSVDEMKTAFSSRPPYSQWHPEVLDDYCRYGLHPSEGVAEFELACPPMVEAEIYVQSGCGSAYDEAGKVSAPVHILRARNRRPEDSPFDFSPSPTWNELHKKFVQASDTQLEALSHFFPMEQPDELAQLITQWMSDGSVSWPA